MNLNICSNLTTQEATAMETLVSVAEAEPTTPDPTDISDVHFSIAGDRRLVLKSLGDAELGASYLGYRIVDKPGDLRAHVQRILLHVGANDEPSVRGSLIDLFIALGSRGAALKQRMLGFAAPALSKTGAAFLRKNIEHGFKPWDNAVASTRTSLLSMGYIGVREIISCRPAPRTEPDVEPPVDQARSQIEYGQLEQAVATLEEALRINPADGDVAELLDELYHHLRKHPRSYKAPAPAVAGAPS